MNVLTIAIGLAVIVICGGMLAFALALYAVGIPLTSEALFFFYLGLTMVVMIYCAEHR